MNITFGNIEDNHTLDEALSLSPDWDNMFISRHRNGWVFVNAHGIYFVTDDETERGWVPTDPDESARLYAFLGGKVSTVYYEK